MSRTNSTDYLVGQRVRALREGRGMKIDDLAAAMSVTPATLLEYENGDRRFLASQLLQLSILLDVEIAEFFSNALIEPRNEAKPATPELAIDDECLILVRNFKRIKDSAVRHLISSLVAGYADIEDVSKA